MLDQDQIDRIQGQDVYGSDGEKIGTARQVYADDQTGRPEWLTVRTGLLVLKETFLPLADAEVSANRITVPYTKAFVKDAPNIDEDGQIEIVRQRADGTEEQAGSPHRFARPWEQGDGRGG